jgi:hypothetical protein
MFNSYKNNRKEVRKKSPYFKQGDEILSEKKINSFQWQNSDQLRALVPGLCNVSVQFILDLFPFMLGKASANSAYLICFLLCLLGIKYDLVFVEFSIDVY